MKIAESLAARYDITLWEVKMTHVEFLFDSEYVTSTPCMKPYNDLLGSYLALAPIATMKWVNYACQIILNYISSQIWDIYQFDDRKG